MPSPFYLPPHKQGCVRSVPVIVWFIGAGQGQATHLPCLQIPVCLSVSVCPSRHHQLAVWHRLATCSSVVLITSSNFHILCVFASLTCLPRVPCSTCAKSNGTMQGLMGHSFPRVANQYIVFSYSQVSEEKSVEYLHVSVGRN